MRISPQQTDAAKTAACPANSGVADVSPRRSTLDDVARAAGVSRTTVSYVLSERPDARVPEITRRRIAAAVERVGYRRNAVAASLIKGRTHVIGVLLPQEGFSSPSRISLVYGQDFFLAVFRAANRAGLRVIPVAPPTPDGPGRFSHAVTDRQIDGLIVCSLRDEVFLSEVEAAGVPCVEVGSKTAGYFVSPDNEGGAGIAVGHLAGLGHRRIAYFCAKAAGASNTVESRRRGFVTAAKTLELDASYAATLGEVAALLQAPASHRPTGLLAFNDAHAIQALTVARELGLRVPEDLSVVGFDNSVLSEVTWPPLTTIHNPLDEQAEAAISVLTARLRGEEPKSNHAVLPTHLVVRGSTAAVPVSILDQDPER